LCYWGRGTQSQVYVRHVRRVALASGACGLAEAHDWARFCLFICLAYIYQSVQVLTICTRETLVWVVAERYVSNVALKSIRLRAGEPKWSAVRKGRGGCSATARGAVKQGRREIVGSDKHSVKGQSAAFTFLEGPAGWLWPADCITRPAESPAEEAGAVWRRGRCGTCRTDQEQR
jgi:hypothetical protein